MLLQSPHLKASQFRMVFEWACAFQVKLYLGRSSEQLLFYGLLNEELPTASRLIFLRFPSIVKACAFDWAWVLHEYMKPMWIRQCMYFAAQNRQQFLHLIWQLPGEYRMKTKTETKLFQEFLERIFCRLLLFLKSTVIPFVYTRLIS